MDAEREIETLSRKAKEAANLAAALNQRILIESTLSPQEKVDLTKRRREALEQAAQQYSRVSRLLNSLKHRTPAQQARATIASFETAKARFYLGEYQSALKIYHHLLRSSADAETRVVALAGIVVTHATLGQLDDLLRNLDLIQKEVPQLTKEKRVAWENWIEAVKRQLKADGHTP
jgi:hypothetical protein